MTLELHLRIIGLVLIVLGVAHVFFPRYFGWKSELETISLLTRQVFYSHHFFIALAVTLLGALCLFGTPALLAPSALALDFLGGVTVFWLCRFVCQVFIFDKSHWRGNRFNTVAHVAFVSLWIYQVVVFGDAFLMQCRFARIL